MSSIEELQHQIDELKERNARVETDKAWETSYARRALLMLFTYSAISIYMWAIEIDRPWLNAIVPTVGFMLSTLTMPWFKQKWIKKNRKTK